MSVDNDLRLAGELAASGYDSAHRIVRAGATAFVRDMEAKIGGEAAWSVYRRAEAVQRRVLQQWMRVREAVSPYQWMLSTRTRTMTRAHDVAPPVAPGLSVNYQAIFGEAPYADVPHDASILGPGAYFTDLMSWVQRSITDWYPDQGTLALSARRPDLWNLLLTPDNATEPISNAELVLEILESTLSELDLDSELFLPPSCPPGAPSLLQVVDHWPDEPQAGTTYIIDGGAALIAPSGTVDESVTIRSGRGTQTITIDQIPVFVGTTVSNLRSPSVVLEGFRFIFDDTAAANSLIQFSAGSLTLRNCVFESNGTPADGWAIDCVAAGNAALAGTITIEHCTFVDTSAAPAQAAIDATASGQMTLTLSNSIVWPSTAPAAKSGYSAITLGTQTVANIAFSDIRGGKNVILLNDAPATAPLRYADTNFDEDPLFSKKTKHRFMRLQPSSPCVGRGSRGRNVGARFDIYEALAWAIHPFDLPCDLHARSAQLALDALDVDLAQIDTIGAQVVSAYGQNRYFPLSELGLSLADYLILSQPLTTGLEPYFGLLSPATFAGASVILTPAAATAPTWVFPAATFATWVGSTLDGLRDLIYQDLSPDEIAQGIQSGFFVNGYGQSGYNTLALRTEYVPVARPALDFAAHTWIVIPPLSGPPTDSFTVSFWLYAAGPQDATIIAVGGGYGALAIGVDGSNLVFSAGSQQLNVDLSAFLASPQWLSLATVYDAVAQTVTVYVNGQSLGPNAVAAISWPSAAIYVGAADASGSAAFTGCICELAIWTQVIGAPDINAGFQRPVMAKSASTTNPAPAGLAAYWPVNDGGTMILDWASSTYPSGPDNGSVDGTSAWNGIGVEEVTPSGLDFVQLELLTGSPSAGTSGSLGVTTGNLDRINRFARLARRTGWSFAELDWALFTLLGSNGPPPSSADLNAPGLFANLAQLSWLQARLDQGLTETCAFFSGILKPYGRGRLGDQLPLFDRVYNRPPLAAPRFSPDMALTLSIAADFETPGPIARRLAAMLVLDLRQLTAVARRIAVDDTLTLDGGALTVFYRYRVLAGWLRLDVDAYLDLLDFASVAPVSGTLAPADLRALIQTVDWIRAGDLAPTELRYLVTPATAAVDRYQQSLDLQMREALPKLMDTLERGLSAWRVTPASFINPVIGPEQSAALYAAAVAAGYVDDETGTITSALWQTLPAMPYRVPSEAYQTIGDAVAAAVQALANGADAATVLVAPGRYTGPGNTAISATLASGALTIQAEVGPDTTTIDCTDTFFLAVSGGSGASVAVTGLTVQNGAGGGALPGGGAIYAACALRVVNCILKNNSAPNGGAIYVAGPPSLVVFRAENCVCYANSAAGSGGALYLKNTTARLDFCTLYGNGSASNLSNGVYFDTGATLDIRQSIAWDNPDGTHADWNTNQPVTGWYSDLNEIVPPDPVGNTSCLYVDPQLLDPANGFFGLLPLSKCRGAAENGANMGYGGGTTESGLVATLTPFAYAQIAVLLRELAQFFGAGDALPFSEIVNALGPYQNGLACLATGADATQAIAYLRDVYRYLLLSDRFNLDGRLLRRMFADPAMFSLDGVGNPFQPSTRDLRTLARFKRLRDQYPESRDTLINYLTAPVDPARTPSLVLAELFDWDRDAVRTLLASCQIDRWLVARSDSNPAYLKGTTQFPPNAPLYAGALTVEAWISTNMPTPPAGDAYASNTLVGVRHLAGWSFCLRFQPDASGSWQLAFVVGDAAGDMVSVAWPTALGADAWYHVAGVYAAGALSLYVDGQGPVTAPASFTTLGLASGDYIVIGQSDGSGDGSDGIDNSLTEVRCWSVARTVEQIRANMRQRIAPDDQDIASLRGYWTLEADGIADRAGNWNDPVAIPFDNVGFRSGVGGPVRLTLASVLAVAEAIGFMQESGIDASLLLSLYRNGSIFGADGARALLEALAAQDGDAAAAVSAALIDVKRDLLKRFAIREIDRQTPLDFPVVTDNDLSDYLLVDVEMGVQTSTSRIVQGTLSLQQYVQRCQLGLEPGVAAIGITDREWEWGSAYRAWEANRKVFLHPETYLSPSLRRNKTPLFVELERALTGTAATKEGLEQLYKKYLDRFALVSTLETVGSWYEPAERIDSYLIAAGRESTASVAVAPDWSADQSFAFFTVEGWVRASAGKTDIWFMRFPALGASDGGFALVILGGLRSPSFQVQSGTSVAVATASIALEPARWYHLCGVFDAGQLTLYVNGQSQATATAGFSQVTLSNAASMQLDTASGPMVNDLAEARVWSTARSQEQILANMRLRIPLSDPDFADLAGYWTFDHESLGDRTGNWEPGVTTGGGSVGFGVPALDVMPAAPAAVNTYHFIGRARTEPFAFYHRVKAAEVWGPWEPIGLTINGRYASPVVVNGRLYLFWTDVRYVGDNKGMKPPMAAHYDVTLTYSWRGADGSWAAPQTPFPVITLPSTIDLDATPVWRKPYVVPIVVDGTTAILVIYGESTGNTVPCCYLLNWDQSVTVGCSLAADASGTPGYSAIDAAAAGSEPPNPPSLSWTLNIYSGVSALRANGGVTADHITGVIPPAVINGTFYPGATVAFKWGDAWSPLLSVTPITEPGAGTFTAGVSVLHRALVAHRNTYWLGLDLFYTDVSPLWNIPVYVSPDPLATSWPLLAANIDPRPAAGGDHLAFLSWKGAIYAARGSAIALTILRIETAQLGSGQPWTLEYQIPVACYSSVRLVGDGDYVHCLFIDPDGQVNVVTFTGDGGWTDPAAATGMPSMGAISEVVWCQGRWSVVGAPVVGSAGVTCVLSQAASLEGPWSQTPLIAIVIPNASVWDLSLAACADGLIYAVSWASGGPAQFLLEASANPGAGTSWAGVGTSSDLTGYPLALVSARSHGAVAGTLLGAVAPDASVLPVANQLAGHTVRNAGAEFLVLARDSTGQPLNAQIDATVTDGKVTLSGSSAPDYSTASFSFERLSSTVAPALAKALAEGGIDALLSIASQQVLELPFADLAAGGQVVPPDDDGIHFDLAHPFGSYYREIFFFIPWLIAESLRKGRHFAEARHFLEYIFKPSAAASGADYWQCAWLQGVDPVGALDALEEIDPAALAFYHEDPFDATAIADLRPSAYQRAIVTEYVKTLIAWGDDLFATNTRESINQAEQLYRYASDLLGPRPKRVAYTPPPPETYAQLSGQADNEFLVSLETVGAEDGTGAPAPLPEGQDPNGSIANYGFYFGVPDNPEFLGNWDQVEDRLYKIRNGLDLTGAPDELPLFEPPMSVAEIQARGARGGSSGTAGDATAADRLEVDRFPELLFSARMLANSVVEFGSALLRALEAKDAEGLAALQVSQQSAIADRMRAMRSEEVNVAIRTLDSLQASLAAAQYRRDFYKQMITDGLSDGENAGVRKAEGALIERYISMASNMIAAPLYLFPNIFGLVVGGESPGAAFQATAAAGSDAALILSESGSLSNTVASYDRRAQEWEFQKRLAEFDVTQLNAQIKAGERQKTAAELQYQIDATAARQTVAVEEYYRGKFANADLYGWMADTLSQLYFELYQVALGVARLAEATLAAFTGTDQRFVSPNAWNGQRRGLLAGESLLLDLARMEQGSLQGESSRPTQAATKTISLASLFPYAYLELITTGSCTFDLSESMYDRDHPGQYLRILRGLSLEITGLDPADRDVVTGSLTRLSYDLVRAPDAGTVRFLLGVPDEKPRPGLLRSVRPRRAEFAHDGEIASVAGGGAVSRWRLELPLDRNRVDLRGIRDVVITVRYSSRSGSDAFRREVERAVPAYTRSVLVDLNEPVTHRLLPRALPGRRFAMRGVSAGSFDSAGVSGGPLSLQLGDVVVALNPVGAAAGTATRIWGARFPSPLADVFERCWQLVADGEWWIVADFEER